MNRPDDTTDGNNPIRQEGDTEDQKPLPKIEISSILEEEVLLLGFTHCASMIPEVPDSVRVKIDSSRGESYFETDSPYIFAPLLRVSRKDLPLWITFSSVVDDAGVETFIIK